MPLRIEGLQLLRKRGLGAKNELDECVAFDDFQ
jgi:hypothetical protein